MIRTQAQNLIAEIDETSDDPFWQECGTPYPGIWMESPRSSLSESQVNPFFLRVGAVPEAQARVFQHLFDQICHLGPGV